MASADVNIEIATKQQDPSAPDPQRSRFAFNDFDDSNDSFGDVLPVEDIIDTHAPPQTTRWQADTNGLSDELGIDEEIKVRKVRAPVAKLDETRLLSANGIPKLRKITKERLKFKGKGYEFSDVTKLLNTYQLWLDDLFPKAKFADGLSIIEKLGHKKQMQSMRKEWIDQEKSKPSVEQNDEVMDDIVDDGVTGAVRQSPTNMSRYSSQDEQDIGTKDHDRIADMPISTEPQAQSTMPQEEPEIDDLDALLAEEDSRPLPMHPNVHSITNNDFEDDEAAMAELGF